LLEDFGAEIKLFNLLKIEIYSTSCYKLKEKEPGSMREDKSWVVYLLKCADKSIYTGITKDIKKRITAHNNGIASKYTRGRLPVKLLAVSKRMNRRQALRLELHIKKLSKGKKIEALKKN
jgi:putative endonuclease